MRVIGFITTVWTLACLLNVANGVVTSLVANTPVNIMVNTSSSMFFAFTPTQQTETKTVQMVAHLVVIGGAPTGSVRLSIEPCKLPGVSFIETAPETFDQCYADRSSPFCTTVVAPCMYNKKTWYITVTETSGTGSVKISLLAYTQDLYQNVTSLAPFIPVNNTISSGQFQVLGPLAAVDDGVMDTTIVPLSAGQDTNLTVYIGKSIPGPKCSVSQCTSTGEPCDVILTTDCGVERTNFWFAVVNFGASTVSYQFDVSILAVPPHFDLALTANGSPVNNTVNLYETVYYTLQRSASSVITDAITVTLNSFDGGLYHVMMSDKSYPGSGSCTLSECWSNTTCKLDRIEACQSGQSTTVTVAVKLVVAPPGHKSSVFQITATLNQRDAMLMAYGTSSSGVLDNGVYKQAYFKLPDPSQMVVGSDISALVTGLPSHSDASVHFSRKYLASSPVCQAHQTDCKDVEVCLGTADMCHFGTQGDVYVTVDSTTIVDQSDFNMKADIITPQELDAPVSHTMDSYSYSLYRFNTAVDYLTAVVNTTVSAGNISVQVFYLDSYGCKVPLTPECVSETSCVFELNCVPSSQAIVRIGNPLNMTASYDLSVEYVDQTIIIEPGLSSVDTFAAGEVKRYAVNNTAHGLRATITPYDGTANARLLLNCKVLASVACSNPSGCPLYMTDPANAISGIYVVEVTATTPGRVSSAVAIGPDVCVSWASVKSQAPFCNTYVTHDKIAPAGDTAALDTSAVYDASVFEALFDPKCWGDSRTFACQHYFRECDPDTGLRMGQCKQDCDAMTSSCGSSVCVGNLCDGLTKCVTSKKKSGNTWFDLNGTGKWILIAIGGLCFLIIVTVILCGVANRLTEQRAARAAANSNA